MEFDRTLLNEKYLVDVIMSVEKSGFDIEDFEFSTQRIHGYEQGVFNPKAIVYVHRISSGVEISYILGEDPDFSTAFAEDLASGFFEK